MSGGAEHYLHWRADGPPLYVRRPRVTLSAGVGSPADQPVLLRVHCFSEEHPEGRELQLRADQLIPIDAEEFAAAERRGWRAPEARMPDPHHVAAPYLPAQRPGASLLGELAAAINRALYADERNPIHLAAALLWAVNRDHPLFDGNKRASISLAEALLAENGLSLHDDEDPLFDLIWDAAAGTIDPREITLRLSQLVRAGAPAAPIAERMPGLMRRLATA